MHAASRGDASVLSGMALAVAGTPVPAAYRAPSRSECAQAARPYQAYAFIDAAAAMTTSSWT
jgi:hypothetical protein